MPWFLVAALLSVPDSAKAEHQFRQAEAIRAVQPVRARGLYERAARAGHPGAEAALGMLMFRDGQRTAALRWLKSAADQGEPRGLLLYGTALFNGDGLPLDRVRGFALVTRAAAGGLREAAATREEMKLVMSATELASAERLATPSRQTEAPSTSVNGAASAGSWRIQLGAFREPGAAQSLFGRLGPLLPGKQPAYVPLGSLTRLLVGPYSSKLDAQSACRMLGPRQACFPVAR